MATIQSPIMYDVSMVCLTMDYWQDDHGGYPNDYDDFDICVECVCRMSVDIITNCNSEDDIKHMTNDIDYRRNMDGYYDNEVLERLQ